MKISLRKANMIQVAINEAIKGLEFNESISINEFQDAEKEIDTAAANFATNLERRSNLLDALYSIRKNVAVANAQHGIDSRLADVAFFEKDITFYSGYAKTAVRADAAVVSGKMEKLRSRQDDVSYFRGSNELSTTIFEQGVIDNFRNIAATAKKQKQKVQDELLELNVRTQIDLSDETVATLTKENIL
jgi:hypothetical protein